MLLLRNTPETRTKTTAIMAKKRKISDFPKKYTIIDRGSSAPTAQRHNNRYGCIAEIGSPASQVSAAAGGQARGPRSRAGLIA
ncbi:hypothetical protein ACFPFV_12620 [Salinicoccus siamensis]|uniref:hypothetical protein n=1 Tax=Salinicoccus siamensis TaxID=381830 RepID=UPI00362002AF